MIKHTSCSVPRSHQYYSCPARPVSSLLPSVRPSIRPSVWEWERRRATSISARWRPFSIFQFQTAHFSFFFFLRSFPFLFNWEKKNKKSFISTKLVSVDQFKNKTTATTNEKLRLNTFKCHSNHVHIHGIIRIIWQEPRKIIIKS
jgi:hypothetical protein